MQTDQVESAVPSRDAEGLTQESPFELDELFFSRTSESGIILAGNSVFQRVSAYPWEGLLNKPHKVIRHPDMPRAVFWLLWDTIKKGQPIGAYVKNRAKDGRYYWVFAIVTPIEGGFLSVRIKPCSDLHEAVKAEYENLVRMERDKGLAPADSAALLLGRLKELGFRDYQTFMATALASELTRRNERLGRAPDPTLALFDELQVAAAAVLRDAGSIFAAYDKNQHVPMNFQVQAAQLGDDGAAIGIISGNYNVISTEIKANMDRFLSSAEDVMHSIFDGLFMVGTAAVQNEVRQQFLKEDTSEPEIRDREMAYLDRQQAEYRRRAAEGLSAIARRSAAFAGDCADMSRLSSGLEVTRIMGKVESARLAVESGLVELIDELEAFQKAISSGLKAINQMNQRIERSASTLLDRERAAA